MINLLKPPIFDDEEKTMTAHQIFIIAWTFIIFGWLPVIIAIFTPETIYRWLITTTVMESSGFIVLVLNKYGHIRWASNFTIFIVWLTTTTMVLTGGGISSNAMSMYVIIVLIAGMIKSGKSGFLTALLCIITALIIVYIEDIGALPKNRVSHTPFTEWISFTVYIGLAISIQNLISREIKKALKKSRLELDERQKTEEVLQQSEERYRSILNQMDEGYGEVDLGGSFIFFNESMCKLLGYGRSELMGMNNRVYTSPETAKRVYQIFNEIYLTGSQRVVMDYEIIRKDGEKRRLETSVLPTRNKSGEINGFRCVARDTTERIKVEEEKRQLEERLQQTDKMDAIGTLAGGIAHDFNNLLMGMQGYASMTLMNLKPSDPNYERLKRIEEQVRSGADLTSQLLGFARGGRYEVKTTNINEIIEKSSSMFGRTKKEITIHRKCAKDLWNIEVDRGQMEQIFMNLYVNAWQAMPGGGDIYLETQNAMLNGEQALFYSVNPGRHVKITVSDTGTGMDEKTRERIFEPFFTTKAMGRGTGLGMATVYGIIKGHEGIINVESEPGQGTTFTIYLPASEKQVVEEAAIIDEIVMGTETILLIDDEKTVMEINKELLETMGYTVIAAGSGQEGISLYMEKKDEIDLIILDMIMPGMSGSDTFDRLREINPKAVVVLSSGYSLTGPAQAIMDRGCNGFLQKPFLPEDLSQKVREMLKKG